MINTSNDSFIKNMLKKRCGGRVHLSVFLTWFRVAEYSGLTGRKGTALRSVTRVLWFWVVSHTG